MSLNEKLAEAMGWIIDKDADGFGINPITGMWQWIPPATTDADAALQVVEFMQRAEWSLSASLEPHRKYCVSFYTGERDHGDAADTFPLAICKAAALALGLGDVE